MSLVYTSSRQEIKTSFCLPKNNINIFNKLKVGTAVVGLGWDARNIFKRK